MNTYDFFYNGLTKDYIDALGFNITYTKDKKIVVFNATSPEVPVTNTINNSTFNELQGYEIVLLDEVLHGLNNNPLKKDLYINLAPPTIEVLNDENAENVSQIMIEYVDEVHKIIQAYPNLTLNLHSVSRNLVSILKQRITTSKIGFVLTGNDFNFIDIDYYILISNTQNDAIIEMLLNNNKEVIIYIYSDYYISFIYEHYLGEKSTPFLQSTFQKLGIMTNYPEVINKVFNS